MINIDFVKDAIKLTQEGNFAEAEAIYKKLLDENPDESALISIVGLFYVNIGDYTKAIAYLEKACKLSESYGTVSALGVAQYEVGNFDACAKTLEHALTLDKSPDIYNKYILSLFETGQYKKAIEESDKMYELYPDNSMAVANRVKALTQSGKLLDAERECVNFLKNHPDDPALWYHLGLLKELIHSNDEQAIECYKIAGENGNLSSYYNIAVAYQKLSKYEDAETYYKKYLEIFPNDRECFTSLGMCYLSQRKFKQGYEYFFKRLSKADKLINSEWLDYIPENGEFQIIGDQGFGDQIQFIRYLPFVENKNYKIAVGKSLIELFKSNYPETDFIEYSQLNPDIPSIRLTDIAYLLNMDFSNIPYANGYLKSETLDITNSKKKVGFCWEAGSAGIRGMIKRTIHIKCFEKLLNMDNIQLYSFQYNDTLKGNEKYPQMINLASSFKNFNDTAKAMKAMDTVVTVDTAVAHLAGALGIKTYLLIPYASDWRWFNNTSKTEWYDSVRIFKQSEKISWEKEINEIADLL